MTNKEKMLHMVLDDPKLQELYDYDSTDYEDIYTAINSDNLIVAAVARIIKEFNGSEDPTDWEKVYKIVFNHLYDNYLYDN